MIKMNKKISIWVMAGVLALGGISVTGGAVSAEAAKEKTEEKESEKKIRPSDLVLPALESYSYADMGLSFELPQLLLEKMEKEEIAMLPGAEITSDGNSLKYGFVSWSTMTKEQREAEISADTEKYGEWVESLGVIGCLGVYQKELEKDLDKITGCTEHEKIGTSEDEAYSYYLSTKKDADAELVEAIKEITYEITPMVSYNNSEGMKAGDSIGSFSTEDINGKEYTEKLFQEADLTMVNIFATWCGPCVNEIPYLAELDKKMEEKGVQIVGIVMDAGNSSEKDEEGIKKSQTLQKKAKAEYPFLLPDSGYMNGRLSSIQAYPETFFVDKNGNITGETYSGARSLEEWEEVIHTELENLESAQEEK
ncbi:TlpA family protein disulfide reductase [Blautia sp.]|jgi:thiol-disulfide isomerase/thioredoxin|uniref:TlpA family protein disulfide reductase n=1 Tax=Blautia sp. TaxID=1955243 RepID=UPI003D90096A